MKLLDGGCTCHPLPVQVAALIEGRWLKENPCPLHPEKAASQNAAIRQDYMQARRDSEADRERAQRDREAWAGQEYTPPESVAALLAGEFGRAGAVRHPSGPLNTALGASGDDIARALDLPPSGDAA